MTRAIVIVRDGEGEWRLYVHGDGYPGWLGQHIWDFVHLAKRTDPNCRQYAGDSAPYDSPNATREANKLACDLITYLNTRDKYHRVYLTSRDPAKETQTEWGTDIEWVYYINIGSYISVQVAQCAPKQLFSPKILWTC